MMAFNVLVVVLSILVSSALSNRYACGQLNSTQVLQRGRMQCILRQDLLPTNQSPMLPIIDSRQRRQLEDIWTNAPLYLLTSPSIESGKYVQDDTVLRLKLAATTESLNKIGIHSSHILPYVCSDRRIGIHKTLQRHLKIAAAHVLFFQDGVNRNCTHVVVMEDDVRVAALSAKHIDNFVTVIEHVISDRFTNWLTLQLGHFPAALMSPVDLAIGLFKTPVPKCSHFYFASRLHMESIILERYVTSTTSRCVGEECYWTRKHSSDMYALVPGIMYQEYSPSLARRLLGYIGLQNFARDRPYFLQCLVECIMCFAVYAIGFALAVSVAFAASCSKIGSRKPAVLCILAGVVFGCSVTLLLKFEHKIEVIDVMVSLGLIKPIKSWKFP